MQFTMGFLYSMYDLRRKYGGNTQSMGRYRYSQNSQKNVGLLCGKWDLIQREKIDDKISKKTNIFLMKIC